MRRMQSLVLILIGASAISFAQTQQNGGWRRADDPAAVPESAPPIVANQDPSQPVARSDEYGQPQPQQLPSGQMRSDRPAPQPYGIPAQLTIPGGTYITVRLNQALSSDRNQQGDIFSATLAQPVVANGIVVAQPGQQVIGRVAEATKAGRVQGVSRLGLQLTGLTLVDGTQANIDSQLVTRNGRTDVGRDVAAVGTTTAVGAAIGAAADWGRGAAIGAGAGAAAGLIGVLLTRGQPTVVYPETMLTFQINGPVPVNTTRAPYAFQYVRPEDFNRPVQPQQVRRPQPRPPSYAYGPGYGPYAYPAPYPYPYPYPYAYPFYGGFGVGIVVRGGGWRRW
jgi:hypothetical protein